MRDDELAQLLLEYGFLTEEQLEAATEKQKSLHEKRTLSQLLVQEGTISVRALKTVHAAQRRRQEAEQEKETLERRFETRKTQTKSLIVTDLIDEQKTSTEQKEPVISFGIKKNNNQDDKQKKFKPVTLMSLKEETDLLREQLQHLRDEIGILKNDLKNKLAGELREYLKHELDKRGE